MRSDPLDALERQPRGVIFAVAATGVGLVGVADYLTGAEISFAVFYLLPIAFGAWFGRRRVGLPVAGVSCLAWLIADLFTDVDASHALIPFWNALVRLVLFAAIAYMLAELHRRLDHEEQMARTDPLTGALNGRAFRERAEAELARVRRFGQPFTLAYIDVDNFKLINDGHGHQAGDRVLAQLVGALRTQARETDVVSRLGGDELAVLLIGTGADEAPTALARLRDSVRQEMGRGGWVLTLSIGAVTFNRAPADANEMIRLADERMYTIKTAGKDGIAHAVYPALLGNDQSAVATAPTASCSDSPRGPRL